MYGQGELLPATKQYIGSFTILPCWRLLSEAFCRLVRGFALLAAPQ
ncbi:hypothetical protein BIFBRE_02952 [Bifidobacterium breve DSM 20213 = JCM 1192]|uniref:Uncharacterized protein n=1 Tax=Bifidobacterium breve DSM 20213 = JCM 1192 TaxID=518634 RepID=D4BLL7_BIFBR|nr:hypothetical protein BIFBRE_02952 [Bifidobacterium breve DSM 20213 = JCM 1192]